MRYVPELSGNKNENLLIDSIAALLVSKGINFDNETYDKDFLKTGEELNMVKARLVAEWMVIRILDPDFGSDVDKWLEDKMPEAKEKTESERIDSRATELIDSDISQMVDRLCSYIIQMKLGKKKLDKPQNIIHDLKPLCADLRDCIKGKISYEVFEAKLGEFNFDKSNLTRDLVKRAFRGSFSLLFNELPKYRRCKNELKAETRTSEIIAEISAIRKKENTTYEMNKVDVTDFYHEVALSLLDTARLSSEVMNELLSSPEKSFRKFLQGEESYKDFVKEIESSSLADNEKEAILQAIKIELKSIMKNVLNVKKQSGGFKDKENSIKHIEKAIKSIPKSSN
jgi:hypothetical protein